METNGVMTANEPIASYGTNSYADVMMMLYSMPITSEVKEHVGQRLVLEVTGKNLSRVIARIDHLARLKNDWDGFGASRILPTVITNIRAVMLASKDTDWKDWTISPNVNGTLFLQSTKHVSSLSLGEKEYSSFTKKDGQREGKSHIPFSVEISCRQCARLTNKRKRYEYRLHNIQRRNRRPNLASRLGHRRCYPTWSYFYASREAV
ncbi:MAG: hypothetical protein IJ841_01690 [Prevotella sp.]|nr:hypothetical protein [Prevotella sp.]